MADIKSISMIEKKAHFTPWSEESFEDSLKAKHLSKIFSLNQIIQGYFIASHVLDECELLNITVKVDSQKMGLGSFIFEHFLTCCEAMKIKDIFLEVRKTNHVAIQLYEKFGFNEMSIRKNYYKAKFGREDAILMGLSL